MALPAGYSLVEPEKTKLPAGYTLVTGGGGLPSIAKSQPRETPTYDPLGQVVGDISAPMDYEVEGKGKMNEPGAFTTLADLAKQFIAPGLKAPFALPQATETAVKGFARQAMEGNPEALMPSSVYQPGLDTEETLFGPETEEQKARRKLQAQRAVAAMPSIPGAKALNKIGENVQKDIQNSLSDEAKKALKESQLTGNIFKGEVDFGTNPTAYGYALQASNVFGSMAPVIATAMVTKSPGVGGFVGGTMAADEAATNAAEYINKMPDAELLKKSPFYAQMISGGASPKEARELTIKKAAESGAALQGLVATFGDVLTGKLVTGAFDKAIAKLGTNRLARGVGVGAASGLEESLQETGEGVASDVAIKNVVPSKELGEDSAGNFLLGFIGGAGPGVVKGALTEGEAREPEREKYVKPEGGLAELIARQKGFLTPEGAPRRQAPAAEPVVSAEPITTPPSASQDTEAMLREILGEAPKPQLEEPSEQPPSTQLTKKVLPDTNTVSVAEKKEPVAEAPVTPVAELDQAQVKAMTDEQLKAQINNISLRDREYELVKAEIENRKQEPASTKPAEEALPKEAEPTLKEQYDKAAKLNFMAPDAFRDKRITQEQYDQIKSDYERVKTEYQASIPKTELSPVQQEATDIADKLEALGQTPFANGMRTAIEKNQVSEKNMEFYRNKLKQEQAKQNTLEEGVERPSEKWSWSTFYGDDTKGLEKLNLFNSKAPPAVKQALQSISDSIQAVTDRLNDEGYTMRGTPDSTTPKEIRDLRSQIQMRSAEGSLLINKFEALNKGFNRSKKTSNQENLDQAIKDAKAGAAEAQKSLQRSIPEPEEVVNARAEMAEANKRIENLQYKSGSLWAALRGKLDPEEVREIFGRNPNLGQKKLQVTKKSGQRGTYISEMADDGLLDQFLPIDMRRESSRFDAAEASQYIKDLVANQDYLPFDVKKEIEDIEKAYGPVGDLIDEYLTIKEQNRELQIAADEQREADQAAEVVEPEGENRPVERGKGQAGELELTAPTADEIRAKQDEIDRLTKENERLAKAAEAKAKADEQAQDFVLTGSNREADQAAARGQKDIFGETIEEAPAKPKAKEAPLSLEYTKALDESRDATKEFSKAQEAYRAQKIDDDEFLIARKKYDLAIAQFDQAFKKEQNKPAKKAEPEVAEEVKAEEPSYEVDTPDGNTLTYPAAYGLVNNGYKVLALDDPRTYVDNGGNAKRTFEKDGVRLSLSPQIVIFQDKNRVLLARGNEEDVTLEAILVDSKDRGQGKASQALKDLADIADKNGLVLYAEPTPLKDKKTNQAGLDFDQLVKLYKKFGFDFAVYYNGPSTKVMERAPNAEVEVLPAKEPKIAGQLENEPYTFEGQFTEIGDEEQRTLITDQSSKLSDAQINTLEKEYGAKNGSDEFFEALRKDVIAYVTQGAKAVSGKIRAIIRQMANGLLSVAIVFNPQFVSQPYTIAVPQYDIRTSEVVKDLPKEAQSMSDAAKRAYGVIYPTLEAELKEKNKLFIVADKQSANTYIFQPDGSLLLQSKTLFGAGIGDFMKGDNNIVANRITPAGLFDLGMRDAKRSASEEYMYGDYDFGKVFVLDKSYMGRNGPYSQLVMHSVWTNEKDAKQRLAALDKPGAEDSRYSFGCINVNKETFRNLITNHLDQMDGAKIFIVPENGSNVMDFVNGKATYSEDIIRQRVTPVTKTTKIEKQRAAPKTEERTLVAKEEEPGQFMSIEPQTKTQAFKKFFGDSKVVNEDGSPMVVYHGTIVRPDTGDVKNMGNIMAFDRLFTTQFRAPSIDTVGSFFTTNPGKGGAEMYSGTGEGSAIYPVYLSIKNPYTTTFETMLRRARIQENGVDDGRKIGAKEVEALRRFLKETDRDGIHIKADPKSAEFKDQDVWIALEPEQIKSATGNRGTFDESGNISMSLEKPYVTQDEIFEMQRNAYDKLIKTDAFKKSQQRIKDAQQESNDRYNAVVKESIRLLKENPQFKNVLDKLSDSQVERIALSYREEAEKNVPKPKNSEHDAIVAQNKLIEDFFKQKNIPEPRQFSEQANQDRPYYSDPRFKKWFKDSKVVNKDGRPLVAFHTTDKDFNIFSVGANVSDRAINPNYSGKLGSWFTAPSLYDGDYEAGNAEGAVSFSEGKEGDNTMLVHLSIQNPKEYEGFEDLQEDRNSYSSVAKFKQALIDQGHDGVVVRNSLTDGNVDRDDWVAFYDTQIKSAIGNNGEFDESGNINMNLGDSLVRLVDQMADGLAEDEKKRSPSFKRQAKTLTNQRNQGKLTEEEFLERMNAAIAEDEDRRLGADIVPRKRGYLLIQEKMSAAVRRGDLSREAYDLANWFMQQNEALVDDLGISIKGKGPLGAGGFYNNLSRIITLIKEGSSDLTATHEILHHLERMMPTKIQQAIRKAWLSQLIKAQKTAKSPASKLYFAALMDAHFGANDPTLLNIPEGAGNEYAAARSNMEDSGKKTSMELAKQLLVLEFVSIEAYQFFDPSEFWAVNGSDIVKARYDAVKGGVLAKLKNWLSEFGQKVKSVFGLNSDASIIRALDSLAKSDGKFVTDNMLVQGEYQNLQRRNYQGEQAPEADMEIPEMSFMDNMIHSFGDKHIDTKRLIESINKAGKKLHEQFDAYMKEENYHGRLAKRVEDFLDDEMRPVLQEMQDKGVTLDEVEKFLHNRHAKEANAYIASVNPKLPDGGSGITNEAADQYMADLSPEQRSKLESVAQKIDGIIKQTQRTLVQNGLETQETIDEWNKTYKHYVPLMRDQLDFVYSGRGVMGGFATRGSASKRRVGSEKPVKDIFANIAMQRERALRRSEQARVGRALYGMAIKHPNPGFWLAINPDAIKDKDKLEAELISLGLSPEDAKNIIQEPKQPFFDPKTGMVRYQVNPLLRNSPNVFPVRINGQDRFIFFNPNDPRSLRMVESMKNLDTEKLGAAIGAVGAVTRWIASVNTQYNIVFGGVNFLRDLGAASLNLSTTELAGKEKEVRANVLPALRAIYRQLRGKEATTKEMEEMQNMFERYQLAGGQTGYQNQFAETERKANIVEREIKHLNRGNVKKAVDSVFDWLSDYNDAIENAVRLSAFKVAVESGLSEDKAASIAKNLTVNFNRKGAKSGLISTLYAFFNAAVQGSARFIQTLRGPMGKKIIYGGMFLGSIQAIALMLSGFDDDEPPEFVKDKNFIFPIPFTNKKYIAIPMPLGFNIFPGLGRLATETMLIQAGMLKSNKGVADKMGSAISLVFDAFNPLGGSGNVLQMVAPTILDPFAALYSNRDAFGRPIYKEDRGTAPTPGFERSRENASIFSQKLAEALNWATSPAGTKHTKGAISPTADQIDYFIGQITGGVGREIMKAGEFVKSKAITQEEVPAYRIPVLGRFYGEADSPAATRSRFYDNVKEMAKHEHEIKGLRKDKTSPTEYIKENPEAKLWQRANNVENQITRLNKEKKVLIEKGASREAIKHKEDEIIKKMKSFNDQVSKVQ
jgi:DNA-binding transcriptional MerR regulator